MSENIAVIISVLSFLLSLGLAVRTFLKERESYSVSVTDYRIINDDVALFLLCIENKSDTPLVILSLRYDGIPCKLEPTKIYGKPGNFDARISADFPLRIPGHDALYTYLVFHDAQIRQKKPVPGTAVNFQIQTTRHLSHKTMILSHTRYYLHREDPISADISR